MNQEVLKMIYGNSIAKQGDAEKIIYCMNKAGRGEPVTIGFIGGSITQGCLSSTPKTCYAYRVFEWWCRNYPDTSIRYLNAGIGGTTSEFGVARVDKDLLRCDPDLVFVEFSVNDENTSHFKETYEGLIRKILHHKPCEPAIIIVNNVHYDTGENAQDMHNEIGEAYQIPCISIKDSVFPLIANKKIKAEDLTEDMLHPNDAGHALIAGIICNYLDEIKLSMYHSHIGDAITKNRFEDSVRIQNQDMQVYQCNGFIVDHEVGNDITDCFKNGFYSGNQGDSILFKVKGSHFSVQYKKTINKPAPIAVAVIDGKEENAVILDANFNEDWGDCLYLQTLAKDLTLDEHKIEIRILETHSNDESDFYLVSLIASGVSF